MSRLKVSTAEMTEMEGFPCRSVVGTHFEILQLLSQTRFLPGVFGRTGAAFSPCPGENHFAAYEISEQEGNCIGDGEPAQVFGGFDIV